MPARHSLLVLLTTACSYARPADLRTQLIAIEPSIANTGDTITLEGTFAATAVVNFPGGVTQVATVLGAHRARVIVPAAATAGELTVTTGGETVGPLAFRRVSFPLELQAFRQEYEQAGVARQAPTLATARSFATSVVVKNFLYVVGGIDETGMPLDTVERATINADGSLRSFAIMPYRLNTPRGDHTSAIIGHWLYVVGGRMGGGPLVPVSPLASIERAHITAQGLLDPFEIVPDVALEVPRSGHSSVVVGNSLYVLGGPDLELERATINPDDSLEPFAVVPGVRLPELPTEGPSTKAQVRVGHATAVIGDSLYVLGGDNGRELVSVDRASIAPDGSLGPFTSADRPALTTPRAQPAGVVLGKRLYLVGGLNLNPRDNTFTWLNSIEGADIDETGARVSFMPIPGTLATARRGATSAVVGNYVYMLGGDNHDRSLNSVEHAAINAGDAIGAFGELPDVHLVSALTFRTSAVVSSHLYVLGGMKLNGSGSGADWTPSVERAPISPDGSIGTFAPANTALAGPRAAHATAIVGEWVYVIGGTNQTGRLNTLERAPISFDGSLGSFVGVPAKLTVGRERHSSVVLGNSLYVLGGSEISVERATIHPDGSLEPFSVVPGVTVASSPGKTMRLGPVNAVVGDGLYVVGGFDGSNSLFGIDRAPISAPGMLGGFSATAGTLTTSRVDTSGVVLGRFLYVLGGFTSPGPPSWLDSIERAPVDSGALEGFEGLAAGTLKLGTPRRGATTTVVGDYVYLLAGDRSYLATDSVERAAIH